MKLIIQPRDGVKPLIDAIARAKQSIWIAIFRFDLTEVEQALQSAIKRGVTVQALIAHTSGGGEKQLRKLESRLLEAGAWVARTDDDLLSYLVVAALCLLARLDESSPRAVLEAFFRRSVSDEAWRRKYLPLFA